MSFTTWLRGGLAALCIITLGLIPQHLVAEEGGPPDAEEGTGADAAIKPPKENKAKGQAVRGTLAGHTATSITVTLPAKGEAPAESKTFDLAEGATVKLGRKAVALADLPADTAVRLRLDPDGKVKVVRAIKPKAAKDEAGDAGEGAEPKGKKKKEKKGKPAEQDPMPEDEEDAEGWDEGDGNGEEAFDQDPGME